MYSRPDIPFFHAAPAQRRLALGLVVSGTLHLLWLGLAHPSAFPRRLPHTAAPAPLTLTLASSVPRSTAPAAAPSAPAALPERVRRLSARPSQPAPAAKPERAPLAPRPAPSANPVSAAGPAPAPRAAPVPETPANAAAQAAAPSGAAILAAARQDAAVIARELNHAPGSKTEFRSQAQEELDRRFDAAHAAGGAWFRSARVEEITAAADGNRRVYRIVTPLGAFCRTYYGDGKPPMNTTCPR